MNGLEISLDLTQEQVAPFSEPKVRLSHIALTFAAMAVGAFVVQRFVEIDTAWIILGGALVSLALFH